MWESAALVAILLLTLFWVDSLRARERALEACRGACGRSGVQLLDETVAVTRIRFARDGEGRLRVERRFGFEFSETGNNRRRGHVVMLGAQVDEVELEPYRLRVVEG